MLLQNEEPALVRVPRRGRTARFVWLEIEAEEGNVGLKRPAVQRMQLRVRELVPPLGGVPPGLAGVDNAVWVATQQLAADQQDQVAVASLRPVRVAAESVVARPAVDRR